MSTSKKPRLESTGVELDLPEQSRLRMKSRDPDFLALEGAQAQWRAGEIGEQEYIERAIALFMREVDPLMDDELREDMQCVLRLTLHTDPEMRVGLGLDPFEDSE